MGTPTYALWKYKKKKQKRAKEILQRNDRHTSQMPEGNGQIQLNMMDANKSYHDSQCYEKSKYRREK